jgi:hypothetical protein
VSLSESDLSCIEFHVSNPFFFFSERNGARDEKKKFGKVRNERNEMRSKFLEEPPRGDLGNEMMPRVRSELIG